MKKILALFVVALLLMTSMSASLAIAADPGAAVMLSRTMPGTGEWYNNNFKGGFPWGECIVGYICCLVMLSSTLDAAAGKTNTDMRLDFWTSPR